jgi:uncharacterized protein
MATQTIERPVQRAADLKALLPGRYLSLTSFKRDGSGVATPLWFVRDRGGLYALTDAHSAKVRRIRRNPRVTIAPCRPGGKLLGEPLPAHVKVLTDTAELDRVQELLRRRYKLTYRIVGLGYRIGRRLRGRQSVPEGAALAITVEEEAGAS